MSARPPFEPLYIYVVTALVGFAIADLSILSVRDQFLPNKAPPPKRAAPHAARLADRGTYGTITSRNIFNSDGKIPPPMGGGPGQESEAPPIPGTLGLNLIGTIVHANLEKSVATLSGIRGKTDPEAFSTGGEVKDASATIAKIFKVERNKVTYRNVQTGRLEYVELKEDAKISFAGAPAKAEGPITKVSDTEIHVKRDELNKKLADLPSLLMQARAVPRLGPDGRVQCYQMVGIQPGSAYESLNIKVGDCIKTVNGESIDSPATAMEMFQNLKNSASVQLGIEREGRDQTMNFQVD